MEEPAVPQRPPHRRAKSSVLKSIMVTRSHKKFPSEDAALSPTANNAVDINQIEPRTALSSASNLEEMHNPLSEIHQNASRPASPPKKDKGNKGSRTPQKTKSSVSVRSLFDTTPRGAENERKSNERSRKKENASPVKPKKSKSSTSLSSVFLKANRSSKNKEDGGRGKEKENTTPPASAASEVRTPIWAQFAKRGFEDCRTTSPSPVKPQDEYLEEKAQHTRPNSAAKVQNCGEEDTVPFSKQARPRSAQFPQSKPQSDLGQVPQRSDDRSDGRRARSQSGQDPEKRNSRVMAAIAALTGNGKILEGGATHADPALQGRDLDAAFEAVLNERNVPENMRAGMRGLTARVKIDFIMNSRHTPPGTANSRESKPEEDVGRRRGRSKAPKSAGSDGSKTDAGALEVQETSAAGSSKHQRSRSKTFTFNKESLSPSKKRKASQESDASQLESTSIHKSASSKSLSSLSDQTNVFASLGLKAPKAPIPEEYVSYLRKVQKPQIVEVGRIHKLRLLLRNETVTWVDDFIQQGGMTEITGLLRRIMEVEWREEHEDQLLHEVLLCLKGLCTTDLALRKLCEIESTLFPSLLHMIFDEEKKGPSEFTTRGIVINLLFNHLTASTSNGVERRARTVLSYLRDPQPPEESQPLNFILEMHQSRPYRVWCKEIVNVTKEVFWIFLHHHNVVPMGQQSSNAESSNHSKDPVEGWDGKQSPRGESYISRHFPRTRPPVPAAPYIGGVEWDATNYIAGHLDLMNGLIASLPTPKDRNNLRSELRASGFEKCMGISLRTCKEKFYGAVHDCLKTWITAAAEDGWAIENVRFGPPKEEISPKKSPAKKKGSPAKKEPGLEALKLDVGSPKLDLGLGLDVTESQKLGEDGAGWL